MSTSADNQQRRNFRSVEARFPPGSKFAHPQFEESRRSGRVKLIVSGILTSLSLFAILWLIYLSFSRIPPAYVLTFGISTYDSRLIPANPYGKEDAQAFQALQDLPHKYTVEIIDSKLTAGDILNRIGDLKQDGRDLSGQNLIVFCSMHGRLRNEADSSPAEAQFYGINFGKSEDATDEEVVPFPELLKKLQETRPENILLLVEANHLQPDWNLWRLGILANEFVAQVREHVEEADMPNLCVLCSADAFQMSATLPERRAPAAEDPKAEKSGKSEIPADTEPGNLSVFAYYVLEGLKGKADGWGPAERLSADQNPAIVRYRQRRRPDRRLDVNELHAYVAQMVSDWAEEHGKPKQTVVKLGKGKFLLATVPQPRSVSAKSSAAGSDAEKKSQEKSDAKKGAAVAQKNARAPAKAAAKAAVAKVVDQSKSFADVLSGKADDPKVVQALQKLEQSFEENFAYQKILDKWLVDEASKPKPSKGAFNATPLFGLIKSDISPACELLRRRITIEQSAPNAKGAWPSSVCRTALLARSKAKGLIDKFPNPAEAVAADIRRALIALTAAEKWLLVPVPSADADTFATEWYQKFDAHCQAVDAEKSRSARASALLDASRRQLPQLARLAADRAEHGADQPTSADLRRLVTLGIRMQEHAVNDAHEGPAEELLELLPGHEARELVSFVQAVMKVKSLLSQSTESEEFDRALNQALELQASASKQPALDDPTPNPLLAGVWQGFWAIEALRLQGLPANELSLLWRQWIQMVNAGASDAEADSDSQPTMLRQRAYLGTLVEKAWRKIPRQDSLPAKSGTEPQRTDLLALWQQVEQLHREPAYDIGLSQDEGTSSPGKSQPAATGLFHLLTAENKDDSGTSKGAAQLVVRLTKPPQDVLGQLKLCVSGPDKVAFSDGNKPPQTEFKVPDNAREMLLLASIKSNSGTPRPLFVSLRRTDADYQDVPLAIRPLVVEPPFDPSQWSIVFKTEKQVPLERKSRQEGGKLKLYLPPKDSVSLVPYLRGPILSGVTGVDVVAYRQLPNRERAIVKQFPNLQLQPASADPASNEAADATTSGIGEAKLVAAEPMADKAAAAAAPPAPMAPAPTDVSLGLTFEITPQSAASRNLRTVQFNVAMAFNSALAYIADTVPLVEGRTIKIPVTRDIISAQEPLLNKSVFARLEFSPELDGIARNKVSVWELKPAEGEQKFLSFVIPEGITTPGQRATFGLSVAELPHAFHWQIDLDTLDIQPLNKLPQVRIVSPQSAIAYLRLPDGKLQLYNERERIAKPATIEFRVAVDGPRDMFRSGDWTLGCELKNSGSSRDPFPIDTTWKKNVGLVIDKDVWKFATEATDFIFDLPSEGLTGRFDLRAQLIPPDAGSAIVAGTTLSIDSSQPDAPILASVPASHPADKPLKIRVNVEDPESGIYAVIAGIDENSDGELKAPDRFITVPVNSAGDLSFDGEITLPSSLLPPLGGPRLVVVKAKNGTRILESPEVSKLIDFKPRERPKSETTGTLRVILSSGVDRNTITVKGPLPQESVQSVETPVGTKQHDFPLLDVGDYKVDVMGYSGSGSTRIKVVAGETPTIARITLAPAK